MRHLSHAAASLSDIQFPRVYGVDKRTRQIIRGLAIFIAGFVILMLVLRVIGIVKPPLPLNKMWAPASMALLLPFFFGYFVTKQVTLYADAVELTTLFSSRRLTIPEIRGWRFKTYSRGGHYVILPVDRSVWPLHFPAFLRVDAEFHLWMKQIPHVAK